MIVWCLLHSPMFEIGLHLQGEVIVDITRLEDAYSDEMSSILHLHR